MKESNMTMDCKDIAALLSGLVDGEVTGSERHQAERHLAGCAECRALVDDAESLDQLLSASATQCEALPPGFIDGVLSRTTRTGMAQRTLGSRWLAIGGWMAAAASLTLAFGVWVSDNRTPSRSGDRIAAGTDSPSIPREAIARSGSNASSSRYSTYHNVPRGGPMTFDAALPPETYQGVETVVPDVTYISAGESSGSGGAILNATNSLLRPLADNGGFGATLGQSGGAVDSGRDLAHLFDRWRSDLWNRSMMSAVAASSSNNAAPTVLQPRVTERLPLARNDAETLRSATTLLEMLMDADHQSFRDVERIRRIAESDNLIARIGDTRSRLAPMDRPAILAVESIVHRIVYGPVSLGDLSVMAKTVVDLNLIGQLDTMTGRWDPRSAL